MAMSRWTYSLRTDADGFPVPRGDEYELLEAVQRVLYMLRKARNGAEIPIIVIQLFEFSYITILGLKLFLPQEFVEGRWMETDQWNDFCERCIFVPYRWLEEG